MVYTLGLAIVVGPLLIGSMYVLGNIFSMMFFRVIAKISFSGYLVHLMVIFVFFYNELKTRMYNTSTGVWYACLFILFTCIGGALIHAAVERPVRLLEEKFIDDSEDTISNQPMAARSKMSTQSYSSFDAGHDELED